MSDNTNKTAPVEEEYDMDVYTLVDEDGVETDFEFLGSIELDGNTYVAFSPLDQEEDSDEEEYVVFKVSSDEEGNEVATWAEISFDEVGVKAVDNYTLTYTLTEACPYFLSSLTYITYLPAYGPLLEELSERGLVSK